MWCSSVNFFNFHSCEHTIPRARTLRFLPVHCDQWTCRHLLLLELLRYLITFDTPAFVLDHQTPTRTPLSPRSVHQGSWHFISRPGILCSPSAFPSLNSGTSHPHLHFYDYGLFNCSISHTHSWSRYYRGGWHQTCPPILLFIFAEYSSSRLITASCKEWAIFAPAAVHGRGSCLSGSLSGIKP